MTGVVGLDVAAAEKNTEYTLSINNTTSYDTVASTDPNAKYVIPDGATTMEVSATGTFGGTVVAGGWYKVDGGNYVAATAGEAGAKYVIPDGATTISDATATGATAGTYVKQVDKQALQITYRDIAGETVTATSTADTSEQFSGFIGFTDENDSDSGIKIQVENMDLTGLNGKVINTSDGGKTNLHIGANSVDAPLKIEIPDLRARALGIEDLVITTTNDAKQTLDKIDNALTTLSSARGNLGAYQNRLEYTLNSLAASAENLTAAESRIRDVDMAKEMMNFTQANILNQSATAMLAQANQQPQTVLQLLQGL